MSDTPITHEPDTRMRIRPFTHGDLHKVLTAAMQDGHSVLKPTHVVERSGEVIGAIEIASVPLIHLWCHTKKVTPKDSIRIRDFFENMAGTKMFVLPCSKNSPYLEHMEQRGERDGYECIGEYKIFIRKGD